MDKDRAIKELLEYVPENKDILDKDSDYYAKGDENAPFVSESYLYNLLGKEDARTFRALLKNVLEHLGVDRHSF